MTLVVVVAFLTGVFGTKSIFHRPRYRDLVAPGITRFYNWWEVCKEYKTLDVDPEFFKSFPSGHTCGTACSIMVFSWFPLFFKNTKKHQVMLFYIALAYTLIVAFSRMTLGAHFLSDIAMGGILFSVFYLIGNEFILKFSPQRVKISVSKTSILFFKRSPYSFNSFTFREIPSFSMS